MYKLDLEEMYKYYRENISPGNYPISLGLSRYLLDLCWKTKPKLILDRGTGFSSFVFRKYALESWRPVKIISVDSNERWINKTVEFLRYCELKTEGLFLWEDFLKYDLDKRKYDIILEDYTISKRTKSLPIVLDMMASNGYLILDDANHEIYKSAIFKAVKRFNLNIKHILAGQAAVIRKKGVI